MAPFESPPASLVPDSNAAVVISQLKQSIRDGKHWYLALLEAIKAWTAVEETHNGRSYRYLIADEALDWLLLAERLCAEIDRRLPDEEVIGFLFYGKPPLNLTEKDFKQLIGSAKHHQYLNYFYGVTVEKALILAVQEEVRKERQGWGYHKETDATNEAYHRIYGETRAALLKCFRKEKNYPQPRSITLTELNEFTYWLFKYRLNHCEKARVASDTRKGLEQLRSQYSPPPLPDEPSAGIESAGR
ncbi:hypothetical protein ACFLUE_00015 [Chloroflexota bacterium]